MTVSTVFSFDPSTHILLACRRLPHSNLDSNCRCGGHPGGTASASWKSQQKQRGFFQNYFANRSMKLELML